MEYQLFSEPMPDYEPGWFQRMEWSEDPMPMVGACVLLEMFGPLVGWVMVAIPVVVLGVFVDLSVGAVMSVVWIVLLVCGGLLLVAAVGLMIYRFAVLPRLQSENRKQHERAIDEWRQRRAAHIAQWERRLGWTR